MESQKSYSQPHPAKPLKICSKTFLSILFLYSATHIPKNSPYPKYRKTYPHRLNILRSKPATPIKHSKHSFTYGTNWATREPAENRFLSTWEEVWSPTWEVSPQPVSKRNPFHQYPHNPVRSSRCRRRRKNRNKFQWIEKWNRSLPPGRYGHRLYTILSDTATERIIVGIRRNVETRTYRQSGHLPFIARFRLVHTRLGKLLPLLKESIQVKERIVAEDPFEKGIRKALNLGHTIGHAFESLSHKRETPIPHGFAVAWGLICELLLSHRYLKFPSETISELAAYIYRHYRAFPITCKDYETLYELMTHDKKNEAGYINFTLLQTIGKPVIDCHVDKEEIFVAFDLYRDLFKL